MTDQSISSRFLNHTLREVNVEPVILDGQYVRLEPLRVDHHFGLCEIGLDEELWQWIRSPVRTPEDMQDYITMALQLQSQGSSLPFVIIYRPDDRIVGCTRFVDIDKANHTVEIGATFIGIKWQRTVVNTEAKYLMLQHAFGEWDCIRVALRTDSLNTRSRRAIARLGAKEEGTLRNHRIYDNGRIRHSVLFSITDEEWSEVKSNLEQKLSQSAY